ncbi:MAG TPA: SUMF1/EgtB/PvdO family nonheme iron enzyme [Anaerolineales bacterium]|nr:SUMF1/EgtB/PvdO family nonheme iron enzyme [Anaerolineales bacterium]
MARIEKTVFISYRRTDVYTALAVYENLKNQSYDVFFDYRSISSGDFEQIIISNIRARAHFLLILTPTALDRCSEPGDWLRREIEIAIDEKRNIVPLFFKEFRFGDPSVTEKLTGKLKNLSRYNGLNIHEDYFDEAMHRLRTQYLSIPLDTVLHPVSTEVQKVVREEQVAADKALEKIEDVKELVKQPEEKAELEKLESQAIQYELIGDLWNALQAYYKIRRRDPLYPRVDIKIKELEREQSPKPVPLPRSSTITWRLLGAAVGGLLIIGLLIWGASNLLGNSPTVTAEPTGTLQISTTFTSRPSTTITSALVQTDTPSETSVAVTSTLEINSTETGKDGMTLVYVPAGEFIMGSDTGDDDEKPPHPVYLDAYWIDQTEVTNAMYAKCVNNGGCNPPISTNSYTRGSYYNNAEFDKYPVIFVDGNMAKAYCEWVSRRLPTEAEWEKAARGESAFVYPWGNDFDESRVNFCDKNCPYERADKSSDDGFADTAPVGSYTNGASPYGALDMAGNVWEWVADRYDAKYYATPGEKVSNPQNPAPANEQNRVIRGGSWISTYDHVRSADRGFFETDDFYYVGFRCAVSATP